MTWILTQRRGKQGKARAEAAAEILRALFSDSGGGGASGKGKGKGKGAGSQRGAQWYCGSCNGLPNDLTRKVCRRCGRKHVIENRSSSQGSVRDVHPQQNTANAPGIVVQPVAPRSWPNRPLPPEVKRANAASKAATLENVLGDLRAAGLESEAALLEKPALKFQKESADHENPESKLTACSKFVLRAERRVEKSREALRDAEQALADMRIQHAELEKELAEGQSRLDSLRQAVGTGERPRQVVGKSVMEGIRRLLAALEHLPLEEDESSEQVKATREAIEDLQEVLDTGEDLSSAGMNVASRIDAPSEVPLEESGSDLEDEVNNNCINHGRGSADINMHADISTSSLKRASLETMDDAALGKHVRFELGRSSSIRLTPY